MTTPVIDSASDLERLVNEFEREWQNSADAELAAFLPSGNHPQFDRIACELVCIDMEMRWSRATPKSLSDYKSELPHLFNDPAVVQELAYEDFRQHIQAGTPIQPENYRDRFGIDVSEWPPLPAANAKPREEHTQLIRSEPLVDGLSRTCEARAAILDALRQSAPRDADRLDDAYGQMPKCGDRLFDFKLIEELGEGAFAKVFLARQSELADRPVALKVAVSLSDEPRKLARLQHTNIVPIYSTHHNHALHAVCMPYLGSLTLDHLLKSLSDSPGSFPKSGRDLLSTLFGKHSTIVETQSDGLPGKTNPAVSVDSAAATPILDMMARYSHVEAVLWMGARLADGLAHAHERGILHLDLKPANILLTDDGQPMLLDFNLSIDLTVVDSAQAARLGGTLPFMSPEQLEAFGGGKRDIDARSDLFSLGLILFEILTGKPPFPRRIGRMKDVVQTLIEDRKQIVPSPRKINPAITPAVDAIIRKLLELDRNKRYQSASQLREDLERQLADLPLKFAADRSVAERARKWQRRHPRLATACLVAALASLFLLLPATVVAVRQNQIAQRKKQLELIEAKQAWSQSIEEARVVQVLLATRWGQRSQLDDGINRGTAVLDRYGIGDDPDWMKQPLFARLSEDEQKQLRLELGEMLLFMTRGEEMRAGDAAGQLGKETGIRRALRWNHLAANCYPADQLPRKLFEQNTKLAKALPRDAVNEASVLKTGPTNAEYDDYHDGVDRAMTGRFREGLELLGRFTETHPRHYQSWFARGVCHEHLGENVEAAFCWTVCISLNPEFKHAHFNRGLARLKEADFVRANRDFTRALELQPGWTDALINRAIARKGLKDYRGARADLDKARAGSTASVRVLFLHSEVKELDNKIAEAKIDREEAIKIDPKDELDWSTRGYARMSAEPAAALKDFDEAIARNPRSSEALINKSIVLSESLNRPSDAIAVLDRFLEYYPDHVGARLGRGVVLARMGECQKARLDAEICLKNNPTPFFLYQAAGLYAQVSRHEKGNDAKKEAIALLGKALRKGFTDLGLFQTDTDLDPIRDDQEFKRLLQIVIGLEKSAAK
jgi:serine/threonine protein kinase/Tfp pilus assembly protein PilF